MKFGKAKLGERERERKMAGDGGHSGCSAHPGKRGATAINNDARRKPSARSRTDETKKTNAKHERKHETHLAEIPFL